jgi:hypothetical protein
VNEYQNVEEAGVSPGPSGRKVNNLSYFLTQELFTYLNVENTVSSTSTYLKREQATLNMASTQDSHATGGVTPAVVILNTSLKPDTRLRVFSTDFHVHSSALKLHSAFFRTFLDSPDKATATSGSFRYTWFTKVDEDGSGSLVCGHMEEVRLEG